MFFLSEGFTFRNFLTDVFAVFMFVLWFWLLIIVIGDLFRRHDISGWGKAIWVIVLIVFPYLAIFAYLITQSRWWIVLLYFGPMVLQAAQQSAESGTLASILLGIGAFAVSIWALVELGFLRGTSGPNRFGADPLQREVAIAA